MPLIVICSVDQFGLTNKLRGIDIDEFIRAFQKLVYDDFSEDQTEQEITELWERFPSAKKSSQRVESLHSQLKSVESHITPIDKHTQDNKNISLEKLRSIYSQYVFETYIKKQRDLVRSGEYGVLKSDANMYDVVHIDDQQGNFEMTIVDSATNYKEIKIPKIKRKRGRPSNNKHICSTFENVVKKPKVEKLDNNDATMLIKLDSRIYQSIVSEVWPILF
ncbi:20777_t:CDS:2 [Dentiscutata erythropus]|uniref:20777_t:CDS:1 n=1 Tax=Dentiscutata erythropus TaxID=1348616 RepID=A0A9N8ZZX1_9GLOM|nr:20777_t:CDS:2 [Dentiscutata erythropus]